MSTEVEIAWAAGLFEGEGCLKSHVRTGKPAAELKMVDEDVVRRFHAIVGFGRVREHNPPSRPAHHKIQWEWSAHSQADVERLISMFFPYFGVRRAVTAAVVVEIGRKRPGRHGPLKRELIT